MGSNNLAYGRRQLTKLFLENHCHGFLLRLSGSSGRTPCPHLQECPDDIATEPTLSSLSPYSGLVLCCKLVMAEFEHERARLFNNYFVRLVTNSTFHPLQVYSLSDAAHIRIMVDTDEQHWASDIGKGDVVKELTQQLASFILRPGRGFYWRVYVHFVRPRQALPMWTVSLPLPPDEKTIFRLRHSWALHIVYRHIVQSCTTMEELGEYRGLVDSSTFSQQEFEAAMETFNRPPHLYIDFMRSELVVLRAGNSLRWKNDIYCHFSYAWALHHLDTSIHRVKASMLTGLFDEIVRRCVYLDQLEEYRGFIYSCESVYHIMEACMCARLGV